LIPPEHEINFYRIVQEGLNNIIKHSGATEAAIEIHRSEMCIDLEVRDNGKGIDAGSLSGPGGMGLTGMAERARMFDATLEIKSLQPRGTAIQLQYFLKR
jgi:signal transduction histidine kinase